MTCPKCGGCLIPDYDPEVPPTVKCANCAWRPPVERLLTVVTQHRERLPLPASPPRAIMLDALAACARQLAHSPGQKEFDAFCERVGHAFRGHSLTYARGKTNWVSWIAVLREAGVEPSVTQIRKSQNRGGTREAPCLAEKRTE